LLDKLGVTCDAHPQVRGQTHDDRFREMGDAVNAITQRGLEMIERGEI
jgi:hypothetical protein